MKAALTIWALRALYGFLALLAIAYPLLPLQFLPTRWPAPALLFALTMAFMVRNPEAVPFWLVAALALLADAVLMRPMGLWALLLLAASETVRLSARTIQERGLMMEFFEVFTLLAAALVVKNFLLWASFSPVLDLLTMGRILALTLLCYPFIIGVLHYILRVRKPDTANRPDRLGKIR